MLITRIMTAFIFLLFMGQTATADAPLESRLGLDVDQAQVVSEIQARHRKEMRGERQTLHREARKLRRAKTANDSTLIASQAEIASELKGKMRQRILSEDEEIRQVLTPSQLDEFQKYIKERNTMVGSSRDVRVLEP